MRENGKNENFFRVMFRNIARIILVQTLVMCAAMLDYEAFTEQIQ